MSFFRDNPDLQFHFGQGIRWERFVPLWEEGFRFEDGPRSLAEARELYAQSLAELGEFAAREVAPRAREIDAEGVGFVDGQVVQPQGLLANVEGLKRLGVMAPNLPREHGGFNFPFSVGAAMMEILARACSNTFLLWAFYQSPAVTILRFGDRDQVDRWVRRLAEGEISGAVAMTEPDAGSDLGRIRASARPEGGHWRLSGRKQFVTNGCGDVCVVLARSEEGSAGLEGLSLFVVPRLENGRENYRVARPEKKFTIRGSATCELSFEDACAELLGPRGAGFSEILTFMNEARIAVAIQGLGISEAALQAARAYAAQRVQMGRPIARHELVADMLLDMEAEVHALRALVYRCAELQDRVLGITRPALLRRETATETRELRALRRALRERTPLLKWFGSERPLWIARTAVQVHGGYGVVQEYDVERHYRNALILPIYEGTSQIQALMSLKDQVKWALSRPARLLAGPASVDATPDTRGDALREMAREYNRAFRFVLRESLGGAGLVRALLGRGEPDRGRLGYALVSAERLCAMLAYTRAAEALLATAETDARRRITDRFLHRSLPLVRMHGELVRSGDRSTLEAIGV
ncbi:MAG TPA: acyl-CoA dehydrogenase family protein [Vicinamibacteria bacterium]|nr:acyl-CoA dehydrogenase family protein [Vicinamibacteria bacterium]